MFNTYNSNITSCGLISTISVDNTSSRKSKITIGGILNKVTVRGNDKGNKIIIKDGLLKNKKKEGIIMNKNLVKVLVAGAAVVGAVAGAVVIAKKVKARKARKAEEVKDENINEEVEEEVTEEEVSEEEAGEETVEEETEEEEVSENEEVEEDETDDEDDDEVPVIVEKVVVRIAHYVGIGIGILLGRLLLKDTIRLEEAMKKL